MRKLITITIAGVMLIISCAPRKDLSETEKAKYQRAREVYEAGQRGGP